MADLAIAIPFLTFYPAIILATLIGGLRAGLLALGLSALASDYLFLAPAHALSAKPSDLIALSLFAIVALIQVGLVTLLNTVIDRQAKQADNVRFVLDAEPTGLIAVDEAGLVQLVNTAVEEQFGYLRAELFGQPIEILVPDELRAGHADLRGTYQLSPQTRQMGAGRDLQGRRKDGTTLPVEIGLNPFERGGARGVVATVVDISERKASERHQQVLLNEIRHRGRNLFAVIQAIALRTMTADKSTVQARKGFMAAVEALARTHDLFLKAASASLADIVTGELAPFADHATIEGCEVLLTESAAQDFALVLHELATNATKYGALSASSGAVTVSGHVDGAHLTFVWEERGGPPVTPPTRQGFGHTILNDVAHGFCTQVVADYRPEGLRYELKAELGRITNLVDLSARRAAETT
jgi:PAS domain S-box-containing protein